MENALGMLFGIVLLASIVGIPRLVELSEGTQVPRSRRIIQLAGPRQHCEFTENRAA